MRLHRSELATDGCRSLPQVLKPLLVSPALLMKLKKRHLLVTAARLHSRGYPRVRSSPLLRSTANHVYCQLPPRVINNEIIDSINILLLLKKKVKSMVLPLSHLIAVSPTSKLSFTFLSGYFSNSGWSFRNEGMKEKKITRSNFKLPQELLIMPGVFRHMLEKATISEMARYPEGTAKGAEH